MLSRNFLDDKSIQPSYFGAIVKASNVSPMNRTMSMNINELKNTKQGKKLNSLFFY